MKKTLLTLLCIVFSFVAMAATKGDAVEMVAFEQGWSDYYSTLALKNNTEEEIHDVTFLITYLDMSDKAMDYEEFTKEVSIAPGMTKKIDIPAYEHSRDYHYYKSEGSPLGSPAFKVKYEFKAFNSMGETSDDMEEGEISNIYKENEDQHSSIPKEVWLIIPIAFACFGIYIWLLYQVSSMAKDRGRNAGVWVVLSIVTNPILIIVVLYIIGSDDNGFDI